MHGQHTIVVGVDLVRVLADRTQRWGGPDVGGVDALHAEDAQRVSVRQSRRDDVRVAVGELAEGMRRHYLCVQARSTVSLVPP